MASEVTVPIARGGKCKAKPRRKETRPREVLRPTDEKAIFQRCTRLLIGGGTALLKEKFDQLCPPRDLPKVLADPSTKKLLTEAKLTNPQWERLYPSRGAVAVSEDFDISLLFKLLTTITKIPAPVLGWNSKPHRKEVSLGADLARIKYYRNKVYAHVNQEMSLEEDDFHYYWDKIEEPLTRIAGSISREKKREWKKEIENFKSNPLTANEERYVEELERWIEEDTETKDRQRKVEDSLEAIKEGLNELKEMFLNKPKCTVRGDAECRKKNHKGVEMEDFDLKPAEENTDQAHAASEELTDDSTDSDGNSLSLIAVKDGVPELNILEKLAKKIPRKWKDLGRRLFDWDESKLQAFDTDENKCHEKAYAMLRTWREGKGSGATYRVLNDALCDAELKELAETFCRGVN